MRGYNQAMASHPWYVLRIPYTDIYVPLWTFAAIGLVLLCIVALAVLIVRVVSSEQEEKS